MLDEMTYGEVTNVRVEEQLFLYTHLEQYFVSSNDQRWVTEEHRSRMRVQDPPSACSSISRHLWYRDLLSWMSFFFFF